MEYKALLETYLRQLRLPTFAQNYQAFAQDAARSNLSFERYLFALCEVEMLQREANRVERCIANAKFPVVKELVLEFIGESYRFRQRLLQTEAS